jgi:hypothetical protein
MTVPGNLSSPLLATAAEAAAAANVTKSVRFNSGDSAFLSRTPSSAGNRRTWTWSCWFKNDVSGDANQRIFSAKSGSNQTEICLDSNGRFFLYEGPTDCYVYTEANHRDPNWLHLVVAYDTTQASMSDRVKIYVNGVQQSTTQSGSDIPQNTDGSINNTYNHRIASYATQGSPYLDAYLADIFLIDGSQLEPTSFGAYDNNGVWQAIGYSGTFGTNGFHLLDFANESTIGHDSSGNNNDFTANNLTGSIAARQGYDGGNSYLYSGGNAGGAGGGGAGGAGANSVSGSTAGAGGAGRASTITGSSVTYGGGGGGGSWGTAGGAGGAGGGGAGKLGGSSTGAANPGTDGLGGGGGGAGYSNADWQAGGDGGSGRVIIRYATSHGDLTSANSGSKTTSGSDTIYQWTTVGSGSITFPGSSTISVQYLVLGGGGGAETGGGGGGGMLEGTLTVTGGTSHTVTVGDGGTGASPVPSPGAASNGGNSVFSTITALGGGRGGGGDSGTAPASGGSGGGGGSVSGAITGGAGTGQAGSELDLLFDVPTNGDQSDTGAGGEVSGNYCVLNPLDTKLIHSNGNLDATASTSQTWVTGRGTMAMTSGKFYWEVTINSLSTTSDTAVQLGIGALTAALPSNDGAADSNAYVYLNSNGQKMSGGSAASYGSSYTTGDVIGVAFDADAGTLVFYKNGSTQGTAYSSLDADKQYAPLISLGRSSTSTSISVNFGQRSWEYSAPSNHVALNTAALPTPTIPDGSAHFETVLYTGNGAAGSRSITGLSFAPDFSWFKGRSYSISHLLYDSVRGSGPTKSLVSNGQNTEGSAGDNATFGYLESFDSSGFSIFGGSDVNNGYINKNSATYASWNWNAGENSNKTYTVTVVSDSGNKYRFDGHGTSAVTLDLAEGSTYIFDQSDSSNAGHPLRFSTTSDGTHGSGSEYTTGVTATGTPGSAGAKTTIVVAASAPTLYYYCTNHSGMGGQINTNSTAGSTRLSGEFNSSVYNQSQNWSSNFSSSNGFATSAANAFDGSTSTEAYASANGGVLTMTFSPSLTGEIEMDIPNGGTFKNSSTDAVIGSHSGRTWTYTASSLPGIKIEQTGGRPNPTRVKLDGKILVDSTATPPSVPSINSVVKANPEAGMSIVSYTATGSNLTVGHGLNAQPAMIWLKTRSASGDWLVMHESIGVDHFLKLNLTQAKAGPYSNVFTSVSSSTFGTGNDSGINTNGHTKIAYCFTPVAGYSAFGSYEGNGQSGDSGPFVHLGFRAKFILLKNADLSGSNWFIFDTSRNTFNVVDLNLKPNSSAVEETDSSGTLDILSNGFKMRSSGTHPNGNGNTIIYAAFAEHPFQANGGLAR